VPAAHSTRRALRRRTTAAHMLGRALPSATPRSTQACIWNLNTVFMRYQSLPARKSRKYQSSVPSMTPMPVASKARWPASAVLRARARAATAAPSPSVSHGNTISPDAPCASAPTSPAANDTSAAAPRSRLLRHRYHILRSVRAVPNLCITCAARPNGARAVQSASARKVAAR